MTPKHWSKNLENAILTIPNGQILKTIFSSVLDLTVLNNWKGACHESCGAIHILLNENAIQNTWCIGEAKVGNVIFDHSWIEIDSEIYDISICRPLQPAIENGPVIRGVDIDSNLPTTTLYGVVSGKPDHPMTTAVKSMPLSAYLLNSPLHPTIGTWALIDNVSKHMKKMLSIPALIVKYQGRYFTTKP
jgi:hypothetical protein